MDDCEWVLSHLGGPSSILVEFLSAAMRYVTWYCYLIYQRYESLNNQLAPSRGQLLCGVGAVYSKNILLIIVDVDKKDAIKIDPEA